MIFCWRALTNSCLLQVAIIGFIAVFVPTVLGIVLLVLACVGLVLLALEVGVLYGLNEVELFLVRPAAASFSPPTRLNGDRV